MADEDTEKPNAIVQMAYYLNLPLAIIAIPLGLIWIGSFILAGIIPGHLEWKWFYLYPPFLAAASVCHQDII